MGVLRQGFEPREDGPLAPLAAATSLLRIPSVRFFFRHFVPQKSAPSGIRTLVLAVRGQDDWPDYTNGAGVNGGSYR